MVKTFIKGDTERDGLVLTLQDSDSGERIYEHIEFNDYLYILLDDFYQIKDDLKRRWGKYIKAVVKKNAKDEFNNNNEFAKILLADNNKKYLIRMWLDEEVKIKNYEADLNTTKRYLIDTHKEKELNLLKSRYIFYDIETDDRRNFKYDEFNKIIPENTILSFSATDYTGKSFFFINEDSSNPENERKLLLKIKNLLMQYSVSSGWNSIGFDDVYLTGRAKIHEIKDFMEDINKIDFMFSYKKYRIEKQLDSYSLDNVSKIELGEEKIDIKKGGGRLYNLYLIDKKKLEEYNIKDSKLLYQLNKKLKFIELHLMTAKLGNCNIQLTNYNIGSNDYFILMKAKERNLITPSNPTKEEKERRKKIGGIGGGYTRGKPGLYNTVYTYDFSSLYPSLEITYNISPETFVENVTIESQKQFLERKDIGIKCFKDYEELKQYGIDNNFIHTPSDMSYIAKQGRKIYHPYRFYKGDEMGLLPSVMIELINERYRVKDVLKEVKNKMLFMNKESIEYKEAEVEADRLYNEQLALKYALNSNYGLNALPAYRLFRWDVADSITSSGRVNTKKVRKFAKENNFIVVYSDTDSVGVSPYDDKSPSPEKFNIMLIHFIDKMLKDTNNKIYIREDEHGKHNHRLILEWEKTYKPLLYKKKKRYAGLVEHKNGDKIIDITGLESTQMNVLAAKLQKDLITTVLDETFDIQKWKKKMQKWYDRCFKGEIEEENLYISKKFTARAAEQKAPRAHTILAERMIEKGEDVAVGDKIKYIVEIAKPKQYAVSPEEFRINKKYPAEYYWDIFTKPLISLMGVMENINALDVIKIPEIEKLEMKLERLKNEDKDNDEKIIKLMERIDKKKKKLLDNQIDGEELEDMLF